MKVRTVLLLSSCSPLIFFQSDVRGCQFLHKHSSSLGRTALVSVRRGYIHMTSSMLMGSMNRSSSHMALMQRRRSSACSLDARLLALRVSARSVASSSEAGSNCSSCREDWKSRSSPGASSTAAATTGATKQRSKSSAKIEETRENVPQTSQLAQASEKQQHQEDEDGLVLFFSQGMTDYCWRTVSRKDEGVAKVPSVLHAETTRNRIRLFGMPKGYPNTTAIGFQRFFYLSLASSFVSNFAASIGYQSLLNGFFLGSSPQLWMLKDLVPALLAAYLANKVVSYENRPKFWFVVSVFMNNVSVISDMLIPSMVPQHLLYAAILTSTVKQSSALMFFVSRAAALQHFATHNNLAELTKKFNSFGMVTYTIATALGIGFCTYIASFTVQLVTVVLCCALNMILAPMSMNPIAFRILNFTTIGVLLTEYVHNSKVLTPEEVSDLLGVRMMIKTDSRSPYERRDLLYISPPIDKLLIKSSSLQEDVLYVNHSHAFMLALWEPTPVPLSIRECWDRYELPSCLLSAQRFFSYRQWRQRRIRCREGNAAETDVVFRGKRLVLLVQKACSPQDLLTAYLIMYTAAIQHAENESTLTTFLRACAKEQAMWDAAGATLQTALKTANWDVELPTIDHPNFRLSHLFVPSSLKPSTSGAAESP